MSTVTRHLFLSPHLDDAVYSCGGLIAHLRARGQPVAVLTLCAGDPPPGPLSPLARELHAQWGLEEAPVAARRAEDQEACRLLGAEAVHLEVPDAIYRRGPDGAPLYPEQPDIFGEPRQEDREPIARLSQALAEQVTPETRLYVPLAVGGHVDHRLARHGAEGLSRPLHYYADLPYATRLGDPEDHLPAGAERVVTPLEPREVDAWVAAILAYRSQFATFWTGEEVLRAELQRFLQAYGGFPLWRAEGSSGGSG